MNKIGQEDLNLRAALGVIRYFYGITRREELIPANHCSVLEG